MLDHSINLLFHTRGEFHVTRERLTNSFVLGVTEKTGKGRIAAENSRRYRWGGPTTLSPSFPGGQYAL